MLNQKGLNLRRQIGEVFVLSSLGQKPLDGKNRGVRKTSAWCSSGRKEVAFERLLFVGQLLCYNVTQPGINNPYCGYRGSGERRDQTGSC